MTMRLVTLSIILSNLVQVAYGLTVSENDTGFRLLFTTSPDEFEDFPLHFEKPLPKWLHGDLVSSCLTLFLCSLILSLNCHTDAPITKDMLRRKSTLQKT